MPRRATGGIIERTDATGRTLRILRFPAYGRRYTEPLGAVSRADAEKALRRVMDDVEDGVWQPPQAVQPPPETPPVPTFHVYAEQFWTLNEGDWSESTRADYRWRLESHLIPYFGTTPLDQITPRMVKEYRAAKLAADGGLSARSINMTMTLMGAILAAAIDDDEYGITRNAARGQRVKEREPGRSYLDNAGQITALLDAAGALDRGAPSNRRHIQRRSMLAVLTFAGLRIGELCRLRWRNVDLAGGWLTTGSKTDAGYRKVKIRGALRDELLALRAGLPSIKQGAYVFATARGGMMSANNFRSRVLRASVSAASEALEADGLPPLPDKLTPHSLRRTFCSLLYALGEDPVVVMQEMGHTDPALALRVYAQSMRRGEDEKQALRALVEGADGAELAHTGTRGDSGVSERVERRAA